MDLKQKRMHWEHCIKATVTFYIERDYSRSTIQAMDATDK